MQPASTSSTRIKQDRFLVEVITVQKASLGRGYVPPIPRYWTGCMSGQGGVPDRFLVSKYEPTRINVKIVATIIWYGNSGIPPPPVEEAVVEVDGPEAEAVEVADVVVGLEVVKIVEVVVGLVTMRDGNCNWKVTSAVVIPVLFTAMVTGSLPEGLVSGIGISVGMPERAMTPLAVVPVVFSPLAIIAMSEELLVAV